MYLKVWKDFSWRIKRQSPHLQSEEVFLTRNLASRPEHINKGFGLMYDQNYSWSPITPFYIQTNSFTIKNHPSTGWEWFLRMLKDVNGYGTGTLVDISMVWNPKLHTKDQILNHIVIAPRHPLFTPKKMNVICASTKMRVVRSFAIFKKFFVYF